MEIKELLRQTAEKYHATLTYPDLHIEEYEPQKQVAEITGFSGDNRSEIATQKINIQMDIQAELEKQNVEHFKIISGFNPDKITVIVEEK
jgi:hypothetical protein